MGTRCSACTSTRACCPQGQRLHRRWRRADTKLGSLASKCLAKTASPRCNQRQHLLQVFESISERNSNRCRYVLCQPWAKFKELERSVRRVRFRIAGRKTLITTHGAQAGWTEACGRLRRVLLAVGGHREFRLMHSRRMPAPPCQVLPELLVQGEQQPVFIVEQHGSGV